jgi:hypothetical protein
MEITELNERLQHIAKINEEITKLFQEYNAKKLQEYKLKKIEYNLRYYTKNRDNIIKRNGVAHVRRYNTDSEFKERCKQVQQKYYRATYKSKKHDK